MDPYKLRNDFPILVNGYEGRGVIYFDNACMTLKPQCVIDKVKEYYTEYPACGGRSVHRLSSRVTTEFERTRDIVRDLLNAPSRDSIIFTRNTTEAVNLAQPIRSPSKKVILSSGPTMNIILTLSRGSNR
ncbi:MAG: aminotransferase class V-fold PLP-dependent enzyme [Candidatus Moduliflexus flocculans]|nr:aminotransferase class V-fold PLP-dependent enzyme [Candidatus Moduliflexus flocculans]